MIFCLCINAHEAHLTPSSTIIVHRKVYCTIVAALNEKENEIQKLNVGMSHKVVFLHSSILNKQSMKLKSIKDVRRKHIIG